MSKGDNWGTSESDKLEKARKAAQRSIIDIAPTLVDELWEAVRAILGFAFAIACIGTTGVLVLAFAKHIGVL